MLSDFQVLGSGPELSVVLWALNHNSLITLQHGLNWTDVTKWNNLPTFQVIHHLKIVILAFQHKALISLMVWRVPLSSRLLLGGTPRCRQVQSPHLSHWGTPRQAGDPVRETEPNHCYSQWIKLERNTCTDTDMLVYHFVPLFITLHSSKYMIFLYSCYLQLQIPQSGI